MKILKCITLEFLGTIWDLLCLLSLAAPLIGMVLLGILFGACLSVHDSRQHPAHQQVENVNR